MTKPPAHLSLISPIMHMAHRIERLGDQCILEPLGLSHASFPLLWHILRHTELTPGALSSLTLASKSNISQRINVLERNGLVERHYGTGDDRRSVTLRLTKSGKEKCEAACEKIKKSSIHLEQFFTPEELAAYHHFFEKLNHILDTKKPHPTQALDN